MRHGHQPGVQDQGVRHTKPESAGQSAFLHTSQESGIVLVNSGLDMDRTWALLRDSA